MDNNIAAISGMETLPAELLTAIQEAFDAKVAASETRIREEAETSIREEMAARYEHDKSNLIEAMDRMLTDVVKETEKKKAAEVAKLVETREKLAETLVASKNLYKSKLNEHVGVSKTFIMTELTKTIKGLVEQKNALAEKHSQLEAAFVKVKKTMAEQQNARFAKIDEFVMRQVTKELTEFDQDHRALNETRVKLVKESKQKLAATTTLFVAEAAKKVETAINANMKREMTQLHEDLERNRQNMFGRRIFEAMAAEYLTSYLAEGSEIRKLQQVVEAKDVELSSVKTKLDETKKVADAAGRKEKLAEDRATRTKILSELLEGLKGDKRSVMTSLLETTKTENLRTAFHKLVPSVLQENTRKPVADRTKIVEVRAPARRIVDFNGDRIVESTSNEAETQMDAEIGTILRLAGIQQ